MNFIKMFESFDRYEEINVNEFTYLISGKSENFSHSEITKLVKLFPENLWQVEFFTINDTDVYLKGERLTSVIGFSKYEVNYNYEINIHKVSDEWFLIQSTNVTSTQFEILYYKCDQFDGLEKFLTDMDYNSQL